MTKRARDLFGLLYMAIGAFFFLCLISYDSFDPSLNSYAPGRDVQNLGGVVGSYLSDLLYTLVGYASYVVPLTFLGLAALYLLFRGEIEVRAVRIWTLAALTLFASILCHLLFGPIGERPIDAGGLVGWSLGNFLAASLGKTGAYLLVGAGLLITFIRLTDIPVAMLWKFGVDLARLLQRRLRQSGGLLWARSRMGFALLLKRFGRGKKISKPVSIERTMEKAMPGPKILPRVDAKESRLAQLPLIQPVLSSKYQLPPLGFLESESQPQARVDEESLKLNSKLLEQKLLDYGVEGKITKIHPGPVITMYEFEPAAGVKVNKIVNLEDDLALTMGGKSVRIIAPLPGKAAVGIEIPNNDRETVWLKEIIGDPRFEKSESKLSLALGKDTEGFPFVAELSKMPHLLVAGATGSGKSVSINAMILSLLYKSTPEEVRMIMIDLKMLELSVYEGIPHLLLPVVTQPRRAAVALHWVVKEMERRYEVLAEKSARNILNYNSRVSEKERLPYIVIIIDELADLMMTTSHEVERLITRLAQMARAAGIHLVLATQRPSVDVLTGLIKANFPARISFKVSSKHDSRTIIDRVGSEHLLGSGDMLFISGGTSKLMRIHGAYVSEKEILKVVEHWKNQGRPKYLEEEILNILETKTDEAGGDVSEQENDELYDQAVSIVTETRQASISMVQRRLRIGYNRAARLIERMEREGVVGPADGAKPREVFASSLAGDVDSQ
ncbi:MAG: DNA translocase FtsK 4TM domain-containing protein [Deltaproteobacteria bacterium]|nr:DNA translocase FtsK 4TM domain-containing protein [Deltaproteobacteria bacterium]